MSKKLSVIGRSMPRIDAAEKVTGRTKYAMDIELPGMLYAKILRSPFAHAGITKIDTSKAKKLSGVKAIITHQDVPKIRFNPAWGPPLEQSDKSRDEYILAEKARFVGDAIAAVAAVDEETAEEAIGLIDVKYDVLPAVFDPEQAMKPTAPKIHDDIENNISAIITNQWGDVEKGFKEADHVFEDRYKTQIQQHCPLEPHACLANYDDVSGRLTVWTNTQVPFWIRSMLSEILGLPMTRICVVKTSVGGGFGSKTNLLIEHICALLAMKTKRPVKLEETTDHRFYLGRPRAPCIIDLKTGVMKDGTLVARQIKVIFNVGAYASGGLGIVAAMSTREIGLYRAPNVKFEGYVVYTNIPVMGPMRGFGGPQTAFAVESQLDTIAEKLKIDPLELRLKNAIRAGDLNPGTGLVLASCGLRDCIEKGGEKIDWKNRMKNREKAIGTKKRGIGMACVMSNSGTFPTVTSCDCASIIVNEDGTAAVVVSESEIGTGSMTGIAQIAAEELGMRFEDINVKSTDTDANPFSHGVYASRTIYTLGNAVRMAAADAKRKLLQHAAGMLRVKAADLEINDGRVSVKAEPHKGLSISEVVRGALYAAKGSEMIFGHASFEPVGNAPYFVVHFADVEVDDQTGQVNVLKIVAAHDVGRAINPAAVEGQIEGGIQNGMGFALTEQLLLNDKGIPLNSALRDYKMFAAPDMPKIETIIVESNEKTGPFGAKAVGEGGIIPVAAAVANAIYNATGIRIKEIPITSERMVTMLEKQH